MSGVPINDGLWPDVSEEDYHGDRNSLSSSGIKTLTKLTPEEFMAQQLEPPKPKPQFDFGHAAHKMVLGKGGQFAVLDPAVHGRTKDGRVSDKPSATAGWKKAEAMARERGKTPITKAQMDMAQRMAGKVFEHETAAKLLKHGDAEMSGYWHDDATEVRCRCRPDFLTEIDGRLVIVEVKSAASADPRRFVRAAFDYGYHQSAAWYLDGIRELTGAEDPGFIFIVAQKDSPFCVSTAQFESEDIELGRRQNRQALDLYASCRESGVWPGYQGIALLTFSPWMRRQIESDLEGTAVAAVDLSRLESTSYAEPDHITLNDLVEIN